MSVETSLSETLWPKPVPQGKHTMETRGSISSQCARIKTNSSCCTYYVWQAKWEKLFPRLHVTRIHSLILVEFETLETMFKMCEIWQLNIPFYFPLFCLQSPHSIIKPLVGFWCQTYFSFTLMLPQSVILKCTSTHISSNSVCMVIGILTQGPVTCDLLVWLCMFGYSNYLY